MWARSTSSLSSLDNVVFDGVSSVTARAPLVHTLQDVFWSEGARLRAQSPGGRAEGPSLSWDAPGDGGSKQLAPAVPRQTDDTEI